jgi:abequosyltransferase
VAEFQRRFPRIRYACNPENVGYDRNVVKVIELATGDYCLFLGSDDRVSRGGISTVIKALDAYPGLGGLYVNNAPYNFDMTQIEPRGNPLLYHCRQTRLFENADECFAEIGAYFSFFSGQIVSRKACMEVIDTGEWQDFCGANVIQFYLIGATLKKVPRWLFVYEDCVDRRENNLTFREDNPVYVPENIVEELEAFTSYGERLARTLFGTQSIAYHASKRRGAAFAFAPTIVESKIAGKLPPNSTPRLLKLGLRYYARYPVFWTKAMPILLMPPSILRAVRHVYRVFLKMRFER